jgi:beta-glucosidase
MELKGFKKINLLKPGESQLISFDISKKDLASFDPKLSTWVAEKGVYTVKIGASSNDIKQTATFNVGNDIIVKKESSALLPKVKINELKPR